ncbi:hypothetical protein PAXRUDRAFT_16091 [Paxillus rubicundulus Ve08.2h10]|uniref:Uncharacterized protein n=1 Tax=Paxillus rubicundulus Ve08.2h10 TaxID=930991 RepID=A0A0D0D857_9AGAM|nr:hypothetical protein PAXRUDRAFT_16091 [Paxillus rubicundulus Ve08.2h10]
MYQRTSLAIGPRPHIAPISVRIRYNLGLFLDLFRPHTGCRDLPAWVLNHASSPIDPEELWLLRFQLAGTTSGEVGSSLDPALGTPLPNQGLEVYVRQAGARTIEHKIWESSYQRHEMCRRSTAIVPRSIHERSSIGSPRSSCYQDFLSIEWMAIG